MAGRYTMRGDGYSVDLNIAGFEELRTSEAVQADLMARGARLAAACGEGYVVRDASSRRRARVVVNAETVEAMNHEAQHNELLRNLDAAR